MKEKMKPKLAALIAQHPANSYSVVIVCLSGNKLKEAGLNRLMDNIYSGQLSGNEIKKLELLDEVLSIQLDTTITLE